jgi:3-methyladenine DNA glycosylase/8-oxoguanine DNA glycosylase
MSALNIADQAKLQWETGQLISPQVRAGVSNWDVGGTQEDQEEEVLLQSAITKLKAVRHAAQQKLKEAQTGSGLDKGDSKADAGSAAGKGSTGTTEEEDEQQEQEEKQSARKAADSKQQAEFSRQVMQDPAVQAAVAAVEKVKAERKSRQFPLLVSAYLATAAILPYRPEPWVHLAKLY